MFEKQLKYIWGDIIKNNNTTYNNNNNKVHTPLSERCSQSRVFISQWNMNHVIQYYAY